MKTEHADELQQWLDRLIEKVPSEMASVMLLIPDDDYLEIVAHKGFIVAPELHLALGHGIAGNVAESGEPALVNEVEADPRFVAAQHGTQQLISVPIHDPKERVIGVVNLSNPTDKEYYSEQNLETVISYVEDHPVRQEFYVQPEI